MKSQGSTMEVPSAYNCKHYSYSEGLINEKTTTLNKFPNHVLCFWNLPSHDCAEQTHTLKISSQASHACTALSNRHLMQMCPCRVPDVTTGSVLTAMLTFTRPVWSDPHQICPVDVTHVWFSQAVWMQKSNQVNFEKLGHFRIIGQIYIYI